MSGAITLQYHTHGVCSYAAWSWGVSEPCVIRCGIAFDDKAPSRVGKSGQESRQLFPVTAEEGGTRSGVSLETKAMATGTQKTMP